MDEAYVLLEGIPDTATLSEIVNFLEGCHIVGGIHGITIPQTSEGISFHDVRQTWNIF